MPTANPKEKIVDRLKLAVKNADYDATGEIAQEALDAGIEPAVIMQQGVCDALMELEHDLFGEHKSWMHPRHLMGAESARRAIAVLEPSINGGDGSLGTVVLGVPSGDPHDFGTKTVALTLMAAGFKVEYLGRDVPPSRFVQKAQEVNADIVGISCYQTSNFKRIEEILEMMATLKLRDKVKVMVGGSVITQKYADKKNVAYAPNAAEAVKLARTLVGR
ncbi:MttC2: predicted dimethylamine corronoid protein [Desulfosarcina variabilis str. Montpellier]|uniref:cobalamin B12-binding domain-containing protein n=1 Tax=Desulfosarcina variabilis TaxID=2300 RepID=UPI003AFB4802